MAIKLGGAKPVTRAVTPQATAPRVIRTVGQSIGQLSLPDTREEPEGRMEKLTWMIYGPKKIGKSSLANQFPRAFHFGFESASRSIRAYRRDVPSWKHFMGYIDLLEKQPGKFNTAVIDTGFEAYNRCLEFVCEKEGMAYPSEGQDRGAAWKRVSDEFRRQLIRLHVTGMGIIVLAHDKNLESETRAGQKFDQVIPKLSSQADDFFRATIDNVIYMHKRGDDRWAQIAGTDYIFAGVSYGEGEHFMTTNGEAITAVPMGRSPAEAFALLAKAFNNEQVDSYAMETETTNVEGMQASIRDKLRKAAKGKR